MVEVLFGESEAASMKTAKNRSGAGKADGPTAVWFAGKKRPLEREHISWSWIEGTGKEVICLGFMLDIGDIKETIDSKYRKNLIYSMYAYGQEDAGTDKTCREMGERCCREMNRLRDFLKKGEEVRVWYSEAPYSMCGFYHLCSILKNYGNQVQVVKLPGYQVRGKTITAYSGWGDVAAEEFAGFLPLEKTLSLEEIRMNASVWNQLIEENSPLRAVVNGRLTGVPESFYDFLIWKQMTKQPVKEARLIGNIIGRGQIGAGDGWYAKRIDFFIEQGIIEVIEDCDNKYARIIRFI